MKKIFLIPATLFLIFLVQSCSAPKHTVTAPVAPRIIEKERIINKSFESIWQSTIELLATYNMPIKNLDKASGFISTEYKQITGVPSQYASCTGASSTFMGKVELTNHGGNLNVMLKRISDDSTKVTVNCFYSCMKNKYKYANILSTTYVLESTERIDCETTGLLERAILDYVSSK
ncbi:hypothetical protein LK994_14500 [Ferruginibacter lapsinanis]|uniref:hypothetical protein n=1 Tax=Ferruginibacter lapsinanis TaxID=563172 RepID=UPI001E368615|nr:hypothetical protein [Ferruginibacter lapsinanis]UEG49848.1 hypothetical protein LK994_14500 [Ferruginibacter lapsinanis]